MRTTAEITVQVIAVTVGEFWNDLLAHIEANPTRYRDSRNPPLCIATIRKALPDRAADTIQPKEDRHVVVVVTEANTRYSQWQVKADI